MKKNIVDEMLVRFLWWNIIGDNALLVYKQNEKEEDKVDICFRYIESNSIKEQFITTVPKSKMHRGLVEINPTKTAIAVYQETEEGYQLTRVYSILDHSFESPEFIDLEYKKNFPENELSPQLIKKRGTKDGKH